jgi:putative hydrolase of the HAD superfamily
MAKPVLLLDLGGVLADLGDPVAALGLDMSFDEFWPLWVHSPSVRAFETGRMSASGFFEAMAAELGCDDREFERRFHDWVLPPFAGIDAFVEQARQRYTLALLSNTNPIHWEQVTASTPVFSTFARLFLSYETGHHKPAADAFNEVVEHFGVRPGEVRFLDDAQQNVDAARSLGIDAHRAVGLDAATRLLDCE